MGMNSIALKDLTPDEPKEFTLDLLKVMDPNDPLNEKSRGQIVVQVTYKPHDKDNLGTNFEDSVVQVPEGTPAGGGVLVVIVHEGQDLDGKHHTNPSARIIFRGEERRTKTVKKNRDPRWEEEFTFVLDEPPTRDKLHVEVYSTSSRMGLLHPKESLGYIDINLSDVVNNKRINEKYNLIGSKNGQIQDNPGEQTVTLTREYDGENITVEVSMPSLVTGEEDEDDENDDEDRGSESNVPLLVTVTKKDGNSPSLEFDCSAFPDEVRINSLSLKNPEVDDQLAYEGPDFLDLAENLQKAFHEYLEIRGVKPSTTNFLHEYMIEKDAKEYVNWLKDVKSFVEA